MTMVGWILSWWGTRWIRWCLLSAATVISVSCLVIGDREKGPQISPGTIGCSPALACMGWRGIYWLEAGLIGFACCLALLIMTAVADIVLWFDHRRAASAESRSSPGAA
ncbi:hypothetical protein ACFV23_16170 [Streptomyces sp. NPDC059627]